MYVGKDTRQPTAMCITILYMYIYYTGVAPSVPVRHIKYTHVRGFSVIYIPFAFNRTLYRCQIIKLAVVWFFFPFIDIQPFFRASWHINSMLSRCAVSTFYSRFSITANDRLTTICRWNLYRRQAPDENLHKITVCAWFAVF